MDPSDNIRNAEIRTYGIDPLPVPSFTPPMSCRSSCSTPAKSTWLSSNPLQGTPPSQTAPPPTTKHPPCRPPPRDLAASCPFTPQTLSRCASTGLGFRKRGGCWGGAATRGGVWERLWSTTGSRSHSLTDKWGGEKWCSYRQGPRNPTRGEHPLVCTLPLLDSCMWAYLSTGVGGRGTRVTGVRR